MHLKIPILTCGLKLSNSKQGFRVSAFHFLWNRYYQWLSDIEIIHEVLSSAFYSRINPSFTAGKRIGVWNCHETRIHRKTDHIFTSVVYALNCVDSERVATGYGGGSLCAELRRFRACSYWLRWGRVFTVGRSKQDNKHRRDNGWLGRRRPSDREWALTTWNKKASLWRAKRKKTREKLWTDTAIKFVCPWSASVLHQNGHHDEYKKCV